MEAVAIILLFGKRENNFAILAEREYDFTILGSISDNYEVTVAGRLWSFYYGLISDQLDQLPLFRLLGLVRSC